MREMKDSGIEWINLIPKEWNLNRLQYCLSEVKVSNSPIQTEQVLSLVKDVGVMLYEEKGDVGNKAKTDVSEYKLAYPNTLVVNSMNILIGSVGISNYFGCVSPVYYVFKETQNSDLRYINYIFNTREFQKELRKYANGILEIRLRVSSEDIFKRPIPLPNKTEQIRIADFLDTKCSEIDALSADIQSEIDTLQAYKRSVITEAVTKGLDNAPMRDSGISWIGDVPVTWNISKIRYEIIPIERTVEETDEIITCFRDGQVTLRRNRREEGFTISITEHGYHGVNKGDLVIHGMDAFAGAIGCSDSNGKISPVVHVCKTKGNNRFFMYSLRAMAYGNILMDLSDGIRVRSSDFRNFSKLGVFEIAVPPIEHQNRIVEHIDNVLSQVENIMSTKQQQLSVLADYKKSVIYEYVTGKKEVPAL